MDVAGGRPFEGQPGETYTLPSPATDRQWVEPDGTIWRLRGDGQPIPSKRIEHLLLAPQVRVLHVASRYEGMVAEVGLDEREQFWSWIRPYVQGKAVRGPNDQTEFDIAEFKNPTRQSMVIVRETC